MTETLPDVAPTSTRRKLGPIAIAILILAASTPLATIVTTAPLGLAFGGTSIVFAYVLAGVLIGLFCIGYGQMSRRITRPGAFYSYVTKSFGPVAGTATAYVALLGYLAFLAGAIAIPSFFAVSIFEMWTGIALPWGIYLVFLCLAILALGLRGIDFNAKFMSVTIVLELALVAALVIAIIADKGLAAFPMNVFSPAEISQGNLGVSLIFAIMCFVGFESAALYAPEAKKPATTVRYATYIAVVLITVVYAISVWVMIGAVGSADAPTVALDSLATGSFAFDLSNEYLNGFVTTLMSIVLLLAQFIAAQALANATARYIASLGKERILPHRFGRENPKNAAPTVAVVLTTAVIFVSVGVMGLLGLDPYVDISSSLFGLGIVAIVILQAVASASVVVYFWRLKEPRRAWWSTFVAPTLAFIGLVAALILMLSEFSLVTGKSDAFVLALPWLIAIVAIAGVAQALIIRAKRPEVYESLGAGDSYEESLAIQTKVTEVVTGTIKTR